MEVRVCSVVKFKACDAEPKLNLKPKRRPRGRGLPRHTSELLPNLPGLGYISLHERRDGFLQSMRPGRECRGELLYPLRGHVGARATGRGDSRSWGRAIWRVLDSAG